MDTARPMTAVGTVLRLEGHIVVVPSRPPEPSRPSRLEARRQLNLSQNPGHGGNEPDTARAAVPGALTIDNLRETHDRYAVELVGTDVPAEHTRARVTGDLDGHALTVTGWSVEPDTNSGWDIPDVAGTDRETADAIIKSFISNDWPTISFGVAVTPNGQYAATVQVEMTTPEIDRWLSRQPPGSVRLIPFLT